MEMMAKFLASLLLALVGPALESDAFLAGPTLGRLPAGGARSATRPRVSMNSAVPQPMEEANFDSWFWGDAHASGGVEHAVFSQEGSPVVLFDGVCNFCNAGVWMMMSNSEEGKLRFCAQQSDMGLRLLESFGLQAETLSSIAVLESSGHLHTGSDAVLEILRRMDLPYPLLAAAGGALPKPLRDEMYRWVSTNRQAFGETLSCRIPEEEEERRFLTEDYYD